MDLKGSLVDTCLRIYPSDELVIFLKKQTLGDNVPVNIGIFVNVECFKNMIDQESDLKPTDIYLNKEEIQKLKDVKDKLKQNEAEIPIHSKTENDLNEKSKSKLSDDKEVNQIDGSKNDKMDLMKSEKKADNPHLTTSDINWLYTYIKEKKQKGEDVPYLHELLEGCLIEVPENEVIKRNPELEARCVKLRAQQEAREYRKMTKSVDNVRMKFPEDSISYQLKQVNRQLIAIGQFILSIFAGFLFGFKGVEWMVGNLDFGFRLLLGVMCALIIALAEIYFLAKKLNEELNVPETTQLGGPPKFVDEKLNEHRLRKDVSKPHQD